MMRAAVRSQTLADKITPAERFFTRLRGLTWRLVVKPGSGLWLPRCRAVHTWFMLTAIDVVFIDKDLRVVSIVAGMKPWRMASARRAAHTLELPAGTCEQLDLNVGDKIELGF